MKRLGRYTLLFERRPAILGHAAVCGKKEAAGPLARDGSREPCDTQGGASKAGH